MEYHKIFYNKFHIMYVIINSLSEQHDFVNIVTDFGDVMTLLKLFDRVCSRDF